MWLLCGAGPPRPIMSDSMQGVGDALPPTHVVTAFQDPWLGFGSAGLELLGLAAILAGAVALSARLLRTA
jgi:ABC-2 type transport system permease protein